VPLRAGPGAPGAPGAGGSATDGETPAQAPSAP
jgi:hypothetical protein